MKDSVAAGFQGRWVTVVPGSEGKQFPVREPCLAADVMYVGAGDHCLVSSYCGPGSVCSGLAGPLPSSLSPQSAGGRSCRLTPSADVETKEPTGFLCPSVDARKWQTQGLAQESQALLCDLR